MDAKEIAESLFFVLSKEQEVIPFVHTPAQEYLWQALASGPRQLVLKARQQGISTGVDYWFLADCATQVGTHAVVMSHDDDETTELMDRVHFALKNIPDGNEVVPRHYDSKYELSFDLTDSWFKVKTAGAKVSGRGPTINRLHCSEVAFWKNALKVLTGLLQTVPKAALVVLESTGNGAGGLFYDLCIAAMKGLGPWKFNFFPWTISPEYMIALLPGEVIELTEEERAIQPVLWVASVQTILPPPSKEQIKWRRWKIAELRSLEQFKQEYPATPEEAFQMSGALYFDRASLVRARGVLAPPIAQGYLEREDTKVRFVPAAADKGGILKVWEWPKRGFTYITSGDISEGLPDPTHGITANTSLDVFCRQTGKQVAAVVGKVSPQDAADWVFLLGKCWGWPLAAIEANGPGLATLVILDREGYPYIYRTKRLGKVGEPETEKLGWATDRGTRPLILSSLRARLVLGHTTPASEETIIEMGTFLVIVDEDSGSIEYRHAPGCRDDRVLSYAIGDYLNSTLPLVSREDEEALYRRGAISTAQAMNNPHNKTGY